MQKIIWTFLIILVVIGFRPYRLFTSSDNLSNNQLLVEFHEYTCSPDLEIISGQLIIPDNLKPFFKDSVKDLNITGDNSPFSVINQNQNNLNLVIDNQFIISGSIVNVDSSARTCEKTPIIKIDKWVPTKYHANFWTFDVKFFFIYFLSLFICILTSIILFVKERRANVTK